MQHMHRVFVVEHDSACMHYTEFMFLQYWHCSCFVVAVFQVSAYLLAYATDPLMAHSCMTNITNTGSTAAATAAGTATAATQQQQQQQQRSVHFTYLTPAAMQVALGERVTLGKTVEGAPPDFNETAVQSKLRFSSLLADFCAGRSLPQRSVQSSVSSGSSCDSGSDAKAVTHVIAVAHGDTLGAVAESLCSQLLYEADYCSWLAMAVHISSSSNTNISSSSGNTNSSSSSGNINSSSSSGTVSGTVLCSEGVSMMPLMEDDNGWA
jgi:hypothetical protein